MLADDAIASIAVNPGAAETVYPLVDHMVIGRSCPGVDPAHRILVPGGEISRSHCEIWLDQELARAVLVDMSTNGTWLNGVRLTRALASEIRDGDVISLGDCKLEFRSKVFRGHSIFDSQQTFMPIRQRTMVLVVGDVVNYSTIAQVTADEVIALSMQKVWAELGKLLTSHRGTLNHYAGDAMYAVWDLGQIPEGVTLALDFALAANQCLQDLSPNLALRSPDGAEIRMGWSVVMGSAAVTSMGRSDAVIGDATNLAFRLSGVAGRDGRAEVIATEAVRSAAESTYEWGSPETVPTKGRSGLETIYPVVGQRQ